MKIYMPQQKTFMPYEQFKSYMRLKEAVKPAANRCIKCDNHDKHYPYCAKMFNCMDHSAFKERE